MYIGLRGDVSRGHQGVTSGYGTSQVIMRKQRGLVEMVQCGHTLGLSNLGDWSRVVGVRS